jgi:RNA polymerase sigma-70 factor (ECF subfamily)
LPPEDPFTRLEHKEAERAILETINSMSDKVRMVFLLCKMEGLTYKEIAEQLQISVATVESHMVKALRLIRERIFQYNHQGNR